MTAEQVRDLLRAEIGRAGSQGKWAKKNGVIQSYVSEVLSGRREPGGKLLVALRLESTTTYHPITEEQTNAAA